VKQKNGIVFILIFINLAAAFAQKKEVVWLGYDVESENAAFKDDKRIYDLTFMEALLKLDKDNNYLVIFPAYEKKGRIPDYSYEISGKIKQYRQIYEINTDLRRKENNEILYSIRPTKYDSNEGNLYTLIQQHANGIYEVFVNLVRKDKEGNLQRRLADFDKEYVQKIDSMNIEEFNQALQQISIIESIFGKFDEIDNRRRIIEYSAIAILLVRAEDNIARALDKSIPNDSSEPFCNRAEIFASQVRQLIGQSKDTSYSLRLEKVESKIKEYREKAQFTVYTGGLGLFIEKPLPILLSGPVIDFQKAYPYILGFNLKYIIPFYLPIQWYFQFSYTGGSMKEIPVVYLTEAAIHSLSLSTGMHLQFYFNREIAPYGYFGIGYIHLIEYASDDKNKVCLNFPGMIADVGFGTRFRITSRFALEAKAEWNLIASQGQMMAVNFSLGGSYLFHGKEELIRR